jgi:hypothetical protein
VARVDARVRKPRPTRINPLASHPKASPPIRSFSLFPTNPAHFVVHPVPSNTGDTLNPSSGMYPASVIAQPHLVVDEGT